MAEPRERLASEIASIIQQKVYATTRTEIDGSLSGIPEAVEAILSALRSPGLDRDGERMRKACVAACMARASAIRARASRVADDYESAAVRLFGKALEAEACAGAIRALRLPLAHEEKAGC